MPQTSLILVNVAWPPDRPGHGTVVSRPNFSTEAEWWWTQSGANPTLIEPRGLMSGQPNIERVAMSSQQGAPWICLVLVTSILSGVSTMVPIFRCDELMRGPGIQRRLLLRA